MSPDTRLMVGLSLILTPTIVYGGLTVLGVVTNRLMGSPGPTNLSPMQIAYYRAGHAHAGVLTLLAMLLQIAVDYAAIPSFLVWPVRVGAIAASILVSGDYSLHRRGSGRGDNSYGGSWVDPFAMRINSIQRHAPAHSLAQCKVGRCHSEHSAKGSCQVRRVGKPGIVSSCGYTCASHQVAAGPLQTQPENIWLESNSHRFGENVHETRL